MNRTTYTAFFLLLLIGLSACTTQRRRDEQSLTAKLWHNTTAHYNGYFNAEELLAASTLSLEAQHEDNFNRPLAMYEYIAVDNPQAVAGDLDEAIKKVTVVLSLHPVSNWSDDCYLLAGQAQFLKKDYESAEKTFRYLINEYRPEEYYDSGQGKAKSAKEEKSTSKRKKSAARQRKERANKAKDAARERKRYNRELKKRRRQRSKGKKVEEPKEETKIAETEPDQPEDTPEVEPAGPVGMISLGDNALSATTPTGEDPDSYFLKHRPAYQEGRLWLARTLIERDNYDGALLVLNDLRNNLGTYPDLKQQIPAILAYLYLSRGDRAEALPYLTEAVAETGDRDQRARYAFLLGQLQQEAGAMAAARDAFQTVIDAKPGFVMVFNAELQLAKSAAAPLRELERMLKEDKNDPYQSQIYYAMAEVELRNGNRDEGLALLEKSLQSAGATRSQQAEAYYLLGKLNLERENYLPAKYYLDSTLAVLPKVDDRYRPTEKQRDKLTEIAERIEEIDSKNAQLELASLPPEERLEMAIAREEMRRAAALATSVGSASDVPGRTRGPASASLGKSDWFAYDDRAVKRGEKEFQRRWGIRSLQDNWRRSNRTDIDVFALEDDDPADAAGVIVELTEEDVDNILGDYPKTATEQEQMRLEIKEAMFNLGRLYRDRIGNNRKAIETLEELNRIYPGSNFEAESWYYLYLAYKDLGQMSQAQTYADKVIAKYPSSNFGRILRDPTYAQQYQNEETQRNARYAAVYALFERGEYERAQAQAQSELRELFGQHPLKPRYALLLAMTAGNTEGKEAYIRELNKLIATYPNSPEQTRAKEIIRLLGAGGGARLPGGVSSAGSGQYQMKPDEIHFVIVAFDNSEIDLNAAKVTISDYNREYHKLEKLRMANVYLGQANDVPMLILRRFADAAAAEKYVDGVRKNAGDFIDARRVPYQIYPISQSNYRVILTQRSLDGYPEFVAENY
jgi:tetratricopeptide (TPR) repeat protein